MADYGAFSELVPKQGENPFSELVPKDNSITSFQQPQSQLSKTIANYFMEGSQALMSAKPIDVIKGDIQDQPIFELGQKDVAQGVEELKQGSILKGLAHDFLGTAQEGAGLVTGLFTSAGRGDPGFIPEAVSEASVARQTAKETLPLSHEDVGKAMKTPETELAWKQLWGTDIANAEHGISVDEKGRSYLGPPKERGKGGDEFEKLFSELVEKTKPKDAKPVTLAKGLPKFRDNISKFKSKGELEIDEFYKNIEKEHNPNKLPMDEPSRIKRAKEQGFNTDLILYHGTGKNFLRFNLPKYSSEPAIFLSADPNIAESYSFKTEENEGNQIIPIWAKMENPKTVDWLEVSPYVGYNSGSMSKILKQAKAEGHDAVIIKNMQDIGSHIPQTQYAFFKPENLRAKYGAAFDPAVPASKAHMLSAAASDEKELPLTPSKNYVQNISDDLHKIQQSNQADKLEFREKVKNLPEELKKAEKEGRVYNYMEGDKSALSDSEKEAFEFHMAEYRKEEAELANDIKGYNLLPDDELEELNDPNYVHRISADHSSAYDPYLSKDDAQPYSGEGSKLPRTTSSLQKTKYNVIEDANGNRKVVSINEDGTINVYNNKKVENEGKPELGHENIALKQGAKFNLKGREWTLKRAKTNEIETHTTAKFQKYGILNTIKNLEQLRNLKRSLAFLKALKETPEWAAYARPKGGKIPFGYRTVNINLPALRDIPMDPRMAEVFEDMWKHKDESDGLLKVVDAINNFYMNAMFLNPIPHEVNIAGWNFLANVPELYKIRSLNQTWLKAVQEVKNTGPIYRELLRNGMAGQYARQVNRDYWGKMLEAIGIEGQKPANLPKWRLFANILGFNKIEDFMAAWKKAADNQLWRVGDEFLVQRILMLQKEKGYSMQRAIKEAQQFIPDYRAASRIADSRTASNIAFNPRLTMFGRYHWDSLQNLGRLIGKASKGDKDAAIRLAVAALGGMAVQTGLQETGLDKWLWGGFGPWKIPMTLYNLTHQYMKGEISLGGAIFRAGMSVVMPSPLIEFMLNGGRDYVGRDITQKEAGFGEQVREFASYLATEFVPPLGTAANAYKAGKEGGIPQSLGAFAGEQIGLREHKPYIEKGKTASRNLKNRRKYPRNLIEEFTE
jgi:hypothetical protein